MTKSRPVDHADRSRIVANWNPANRLNPFDAIMENWVEGATHTLRAPDDGKNGYTIRVSFTTYVDHRQWTRVRSTNWRAEDEPNGVFNTRECRLFYRRLVDAGFVAE